MAEYRYETFQEALKYKRLLEANMYVWCGISEQSHSSIAGYSDKSLFKVDSDYSLLIEVRRGIGGWNVVIKWYHFSTYVIGSAILFGNYASIVGFLAAVENLYDYFGRQDLPGSVLVHAYYVDNFTRGLQ